MNNKLRFHEDQIWTWDTARLNSMNLNIQPDAETYRIADQPMVLPYPDTIQLSDAAAEELYELGRRSLPVNPFTVPLPVFEVNIMWAYDYDTGIGKLLQQDPYRSVYRIDALFVANAPIPDSRWFSNYVTCRLTLHDTTDGSAGITDVAIFTFLDKGDDFVKSLPHWRAYGTDWLCNDKQLEKISVWLGFLWRGIQLRMLNRPEMVRQRHKRVPKDEVPEAKTYTGERVRIVKVVREIFLLPDDKAPDNLYKREITLGCWGVAGHWRQYKSGKRVWVKPFLKGKQRNDKAAYTAKGYELTHS